MSKRKSSEEIRVYVPEDSSGNNIRHLRVSVPPQYKSDDSKFQSSGKSLIVLAPEISKRNLKTVFTDSAKTMTNIIEKNYPKTKLTARDKSQDHRSPSPRLKTFPAEKIKKIDGSTLLQKPVIPPLNYESIYAPSPEQNNGYGDALATSQQIQITPRQHSKNSSISQQNVPHTYRIGNPNQSEAVLPSKKPETSGEQPYRPFVAKLPNGVIIREVIPKKPVTPRPIISHMPTDLTRQSNQEQNNLKIKEHESIKPQPQESPQPSSEIQEPDYEKQPIGGRVAALHRQRILEQKQVSQKPVLQTPVLQKPILQSQMVQKQIPQETQQPIHLYQVSSYQIPQKQIQHISPQNVPPVFHDRAPVWPDAVSRSESIQHQMQLPPQQVYQQLQKNAAHQQQMQQRTMAHQDQMLINQMQQRAYYDYYYQQQQKNQESRSPGMTSPQDLSIHRERNHHVHHMTAGNQGYQNSIPISKDDPSVRTQLNPFAIDLVTPHPIQQQSYFQTPHYQQLPQTRKTTMHSLSNNVQTNHNCLTNNTKDHQSRPTPQQLTEIVDRHEKQSEGKKVYQFTPQMISDQEQLIATMQQQRIPEEVMQRQFQLLLNEQKKQLVYWELLTQGEGNADIPLAHRVSNKITKIQSDEKPEWMAHITPPRVPYSDLEKVKSLLCQNMQNVHNNQDCVRQAENPGNQVQIDQSQCHQYQVQDPQKQFQNEQQSVHQHKIAHQQYQLQLQQHQHLMQQQQVKEHQIQDKNSYQTCQHHQYYQYPHQFQNQNFQNWQQSGPIPNPNPEPKHYKNVEPSSLLQLRLYKEVIQPQKRNNGLQDPETVREALETLKNAETKKGLEYLANLNKRETIIRLNGAQEPGETPANILQRPSENLEEMPKKISANGLENKRNPNNPLPPPAAKIRHLEDQNVEYPRSKNYNRVQNFTHVAERENGSIAPILHLHPQIDYIYKQIPQQNLSSIQNLGNQQLQQFYKKRQMASDAEGDAVVPELNEFSGNEYMNQPGGDQQNKTSLKQQESLFMGPIDIQERRIIGGVTYFARKPSYIPNVPVSAESYSGNVLPNKS